ANRTSGGGWRWCLVCDERGLSDALLNLFLFMPLGMALVTGGLRPGRAALIGMVASGVIEALQLHLIPGRDASLRDLVVNSLGTWLGAGLAGAAPRWYARSWTLARRASTGSLTAAWLVVLGSNLLTLPSLPRGQYFGQWNHDFGRGRWGRATVLSVFVGSSAVGDRRLPNSREIRELLLSGAPIRVAGVAGDPVAFVTSFLSIGEERPRQIVLLGPDRDDFVFRYRTLATAIGLDQPTLRLRGALRSVNEGDTILVRASLLADDYCLVVNNMGGCGIGHSAAAGWQLLLAPGYTPAWLDSLAGAAWLAVLTIPFASWTRRPARLILGTIILATAPVAGALVPGVLLPNPFEWLGLPLGAVLGYALGQRLSNLGQPPGRQPRPVFSKDLPR
ncbi:MAG TPA: VanZ family protein, partial [Candidatus Methylomirabilis sp.]